MYIGSKAISAHEGEVLKLLQSQESVRIGDIVRWLNRMGSHETFEAPQKKTTVRKVYQIIRNLRELGCPIVGDHHGIWIAKSVEEVEAFAYHLEQKARSDVASMLHLKKQMLKMVNINPHSLFDSLNLDLDKTTV